MTETSPQDTENTNFRWKFFTGWMVVLTLIYLGYHFNYDGRDRTIQGFALLVYLTVSSISLLIWWLLLSGLSIQTKLKGMVAPLLLIILFRFDSFDGDVVPIIKLRWSPKSGVAPTLVEDAHLDLTKLDLTRYQLQETDWPDFRGIGRMGIVKEARYTSDWLEPNLEWKISVGKGWSSFIAVRDVCWTMEQIDSLEAITAYDLNSGAKLWQRPFSERFDETFGGPGPRTTPVYEDGRIWTLGATGLLNCFDAATGTPFWKVNILLDNEVANIEWGMSATPLLYKDLIITLPGGTNGNSLVAYDKMTGEKKWSGGNSIASYSSPQISVVDGVEQILVHNGIGISAHSPEDGKVLWDFPWTTASKVNVAQPIVYDNNKVILSTGYTVGTVCLEVTQDDGLWKVKEKWISHRLKAKFNASVAKGKLLFGLDEGILTCLDMDTGDWLWKGGRYGYGQMILAEDTIIILTDKGEIVFVEAQADHHVELGRFQAIQGKTWQHPILANHRLLVRNDQEAACFLLASTEH